MCLAQSTRTLPAISAPTPMKRTGPLQLPLGQPLLLESRQGQPQWMRPSLL